MVGILAAFLNATFGTEIRKAQKLGEDVRAQIGRTVVEAKQKLGEPVRTTDYKSYVDSAEGYARSLAPDPPIVECDYVLEYNQLTTIGMLYVKNGIVVQTYVGGT